MKHVGRIVTVITLSVLLSTLAFTAYATKSPKPGGACPTAKVQVQFNGKFYTCVKSKGRLVWNKGVRIKGVIPTPTPTPTATISSKPTTTTPSPSASPTPTSTATPSSSPAPGPTPNPTPPATRFTIEDVRANNSITSCWTVIDGNVYNLTRWINAHPGGPIAIRSLCGADGTASFKGQHQNQASPMERLGDYFLGPLSK